MSCRLSIQNSYEQIEINGIEIEDTFLKIIKLYLENKPGLAQKFEERKKK